MKSRAITFAVLIVFLVSPLMMSCSDEKEKEEKGKIEQFTDKTADKGIEYIKTPLDSARKAQELANQHTEQMQELEEETKK